MFGGEVASAVVNVPSKPFGLVAWSLESLGVVDQLLFFLYIA